MKVVTSKADGSILSSITRLALIDILKNNQISIEEKDLTLDEVYKSKEAFIASSIGILFLLFLLKIILLAMAI